STDSWFRPSDVCVAPDGSIFVADWYAPGVGGHGMGDWTRGRIYRLTPKGHTGYQVPRHDIRTPAGLAAALQSPCASARAAAIARLSELGEGSEEFESVVTAAAQRGSAPDSAEPWQLARALWQRKNELAEILGRFDRPGAAGDLAERIACQRIRQFASRYPSFGPLSPETKARLHAVVESFTPPVRRELILALRQADVETAREFFYPLAQKYSAPDHFYRAALNIACGTDPVRRAAILADFDQQFPAWNDTVADLVWELRPKSMLPKLERLLADSSLSPAQRARIVEIIGVYDDPNSALLMIKVLASDPSEEVQNRALGLLRTYLPSRWLAAQRSPELTDTIGRLLADASTRVRGIRLVAAARFVPGAKGVIAVANDPAAPMEHRVEAVRALGQINDEIAVIALTELLRRSEETIAFRLEAAAALGTLLRLPGSERLAAPALTALQELLLAPDSPNDELRAAALDVLTSVRAGTDWLLSLKESGKMPEWLEGRAGRLLRNSPFQAQRNKAMLLFPAPGKLDPSQLPPIATLARSRGNAERGQQLLAASRNNEAQCLKCHTIRGIGGQVGPDLSMIGLKASRENLLESILNPSKAIADQFAQYTIETKTGQVISGILIGQGDASVTLRDANGKDHTFTSADVESMSRSPVSIMPADIVKAFSEDELLDVVEYLLTLRTPAYTAMAWQIVGPFSAPSMLEGLERATDVEKYPHERSDTFTEEGERRSVHAGNLGRLSWREVRIDAQGYVDLSALHGAAAKNSFSYAFTAVLSPVDQPATVLLGSDDGAKLFVNGELVITVRETRAAAPDQNRATVRLKKGINTILLKVANGDGPHGFYLTIESGQELKAANTP
ncbi:MAG: c-type cytochrome, partial [Gemmataceae bacterium]|nr:c-type cytochrome [Gemmataceae bacterium]